jgi:hypothetical protein
MTQIIKACQHGNNKISGCRKCAKIYANRRTKNKPLYLWESAKSRAKKRGLIFKIKVSDVVIPATCPVLGIPIDWRNRDHAASIDEIVQGKGYISENICVISGRANRIKSDASLAELRAIVLYIQIRSSEQFGRWPE